jgi:hypothetical protein
MKNLILILATAIGLTTHLSFADLISVPVPAPGSGPSTPANKCADIVKSLQQVYQNLYNVDTRPLAIDSYRAYRDNIELLRDQTALLDSLCQSPLPTPGPTEQVIYKLKELRWIGPSNYTDPCSTNDFTAVSAEFEETSIRECFRDGYQDCAIQRHSRPFNFADAMQSNTTWKCSASLDIIISAKK